MYKLRKSNFLIIALFLMTIFLASSAASAAGAQTPPDIIGHWAQGPIESMLAQGIASGYPDGTYGPDNQITRAEFCSMINRAFKFTAEVDINYWDVKPGDWYYNDIAKARAAGYMAGDANGTMRPNDPINRQEMAVIIDQLLKLDHNGVEILSGFSDWPNISVWARNAVAAVVEAGYMSGDTNGTFNPLQPASRAMAATVLNGVINNPPTPPTTPIDQGSTSSGGSSGGSSSGSEDHHGPFIVNIFAPNLIISQVGSTYTYDVSMINTDSIGKVIITFNEAIQKCNPDDIELRAYSDFDATGQLIWFPGSKDFVKNWLYNEFSPGTSGELIANVESDYGLLYDSMSLYFSGMPEVKCIQADIFDLANNKTTITLNIYSPTI